MIHIHSLQEKDTFICETGHPETSYPVPENKRQMLKGIKWENPFRVLKYSIVCVVAGSALCAGMYGLEQLVAFIGQYIIK